jgi:SanA protein
VLKRIFKFSVFFVFIIILILIIINFYIVSFSKDKIFKKLENLEKTKIWLVLWASVKSNWIPSDILKDRLLSAFEAYRQSKIEKIIVSWDNSKKNYNEPQAMKDYLINLWVEETDIFQDFAWFDTYDSIFRSREIFSAKEIVIFTQEYHLYRAVYISNRLWISAIWFISDKEKYLWIVKFRIREFLARLKAFLEVEILKSETKYKKDVKIEIK